jgi:hypothetical protein
VTAEECEKLAELKRRVREWKKRTLEIAERLEP